MGEVCPGSQPTTLMAQNGVLVSVVSTWRAGEKVSDPPRSRTSTAGSPLPAGVVDAPAGDDVLAVDDSVVLQDLDPVLHVRREEDAAAGPDDVGLVGDEVPGLPAECDLDLLVGMRVALRLGPGGIEHERDLEPLPGDGRSPSRGVLRGDEVGLHVVPREEGRAPGTAGRGTRRRAHLVEPDQLGVFQEPDRVGHARPDQHGLAGADGPLLAADLVGGPSRQDRVDVLSGRGTELDGAAGRMDVASDGDPLAPDDRGPGPGLLGGDGLVRHLAPRERRHGRLPSGGIARRAGEDRLTGRSSPACRSRPCYLTASAPALAHWPSWSLAPPDRPMAPTILPSTTSGMPPSTGIAPSRPRIRRPAPPPATMSWKTLLGRL